MALNSEGNGSRLYDTRPMHNDAMGTENAWQVKFLIYSESSKGTGFSPIVFEEVHMMESSGNRRFEGADQTTRSEKLPWHFGIEIEDYTMETF